MRDHGFNEFRGVAERAVIIEIKLVQVISNQKPLPDPIKNFKIREANLNAILAQNMLAKRVERGDLQIVIPTGWQKEVKALFHLPGCFFPECESEDLIGFNSLFN